MAAEDLMQIISSGRNLTAEGNSNAELKDKAIEVLIEAQRKEIEKQNEEIEDLKQDREQRKIFGYCIFGFMCLYMAASLVIVFLCGYRVLHLDVSVLITLLTTTFANVIGVFNFVAKYLFHNK